MSQFFPKLKNPFLTSRLTLASLKFRPASPMALRGERSKLNAKAGFTLIEVMVTVAIVLILSGFSFSVITSSQRSNRDTIRKTDLSNIQSALQQYYTDQSFYPSLTVTGLTVGSAFNNCLGNPTSPCTPNKIYLNKLPGDPTSGSSYYYMKFPNSPACDNTSVDSRCYNYCLYSSLENPPASLNSPSPSCPIPLSVAGTTYNYVVTQP